MVEDDGRHRRSIRRRSESLRSQVRKKKITTRPENWFNALIWSRDFWWTSHVPANKQKIRQRFALRDDLQALCTFCISEDTEAIDSAAFDFDNMLFQKCTINSKVFCPRTFDRFPALIQYLLSSLHERDAFLKYHADLGHAVAT